MGLLDLFRIRGRQKEERKIHGQVEKIPSPKIIKIHQDYYNLRSIMISVARQLKEHDYRVIQKLEILPKDMIKELNAARKTMPLLYPKIEESMRKAIPDLIDRNVIKIISENRNISSLALLDIALKVKVCTRNTLYLHLKKLEAQGMIRKYRQGHKIIYALPVVEEKIPEDSQNITSG
jgi:DNA-binding HxlR family transcriptional regulator